MDDFLIVLVPESVLQISCEAAKVASIAVSQIEAGTSLPHPCSSGAIQGSRQVPSHPGPPRRAAGSNKNIAGNDRCTIRRVAGFSEKARAVLPNRAFDPPTRPSPCPNRSLGRTNTASTPPSYAWGRAGQRWC